MKEKENEKKNTYNGSKNLISADKRSPEERKRLGSLGGKKAQEINKKRRTAQEIMQMLLDCKINQAQAKEKLGEYAEYLPQEATLFDLVSLVQIREATDGNTKAAEYVRDTSGNKPIERQEITADIMTESDRALLEKIAKRQGIETETKQ